MICVAISDRRLRECLAILDKVEMAEIRLDLTGFKSDEIRTVFSHHTPSIATCRPDKKGEKEQLQILTLAIESGAQFVDIETEASPKQQKAVIDVARKNSCKVIISYHNYKETPSIQELNKIIDICFEQGADIAKITTLSHSKSDNARILSLYNSEKPLVAFGMGEAGKITRIIAPILGAEFTFASMDDFEGTAPGQIPYSRMKKLASDLNRELDL